MNPDTEVWVAFEKMWNIDEEGDSTFKWAVIKLPPFEAWSTKLSCSQSLAHQLTFLKEYLGMNNQNVLRFLVELDDIRNLDIPFLQIWFALGPLWPDTTFIVLIASFLTHYLWNVTKDLIG